MVRGRCLPLFNIKPEYDYSKKLDKDAFFTPRETSQKIVDYLLEEYPEWRGLEWVEPSAGDGSFIDACESRGISVTGYDIDPKRDDIIQADFLYDEIDLTGKIVIGNPPFGKRNQLAIDFINQAFLMGAEKVAFLLFSSVIAVSSLKNLYYSFERVKVVDTGFVGVDGSSNKQLERFTPVLVVFDKKGFDPGVLRNFVDGPFVSTIVDTSCDDCVLTTGGWVGLVKDFEYRNDLTPDSRRPRSRLLYFEGDKVRKAMIYKPLFNIGDEGLYDTLLSLIRFNKWNGFSSSVSLNYWLSVIDRFDLEEL